MLEKLKWYFVEIALKKYLPVGIAAGFTAGASYLVAHAGALEQYGITCGAWPLQWPAGDVPTGNVILIELDTLKNYVLIGVPVLISIVARAFQHHTTGTPIVPGGNRASDPPKPQEEPK